MSTKILFRTLLVGAFALFLLGCSGQGRPAEEAELEQDAVDSIVVDEADSAPEAEVEEPVVEEQPQLTILADGQILNGRPPLPLAFETSGKLLAVRDMAPVLRRAISMARGGLMVRMIPPE